VSYLLKDIDNFGCYVTGFFDYLVTGKDANYNVKDGVELEADDGTKYIIKAVIIEQSFVDVDANNVIEANKPTELTMPKDSEFEVTFNKQRLKELPILSKEQLSKIPAKVGKHLIDRLPEAKRLY